MVASVANKWDLAIYACKALKAVKGHLFAHMYAFMACNFGVKHFEGIIE